MRRQGVDPLEVPNYAYPEAVRYLHIPNTTLHRWLRRDFDLIRPAGTRAFSFTNMVELYVIKGLEEIHGVELKQIRRAVEYLRENLQARHPLADFELKTDGQWVLIFHKGEYINISLMGQVGIGPILDTYLRRVERDWQKAAAAALYPFMRMEQMRAVQDHPKVVVMNPHVCFGRPVLVGTRIMTAMLASRYLGGDSIPTLAESYGRSEAEIAEAVCWETGQELKAA
jgi:uncharacterized protein (DUF433 family)